MIFLLKFPYMRENATMFFRLPRRPSPLTPALSCIIMKERSGDKVLLSDGTLCEVEGVTLKHLETPETTYNFEVVEFHTYYVSDACVLVHNACSIPANNSPANAGRKGAFRAAKKSLGIAQSQQPTQVIKETIRQGGKTYTQRIYAFGNKMIRDDVVGHVFSDGVSFGRHFNAGIIDGLGRFVSSGLHFFY
ncbi:MAG: hypothetical protein DBX60_06750 [Bacillota bacterium]|nr:MAG: hypothetical protein DBX60_06750 [Bacillota bacterium]